MLPSGPRLCRKQRFWRQWEKVAAVSPSDSSGWQIKLFITVLVLHSVLWNYLTTLTYNLSWSVILTGRRVDHKQLEKTGSCLLVTDLQSLKFVSFSWRTAASKNLHINLFLLCGVSKVCSQQQIKFLSLLWKMDWQVSVDVLTIWTPQKHLSAPQEVSTWYLQVRLEVKCCYTTS